MKMHFTFFDKQTHWAMFGLRIDLKHIRFGILIFGRETGFYLGGFR